MTFHHFLTKWYNCQLMYVYMSTYLHLTYDFNLSWWLYIMKGYTSIPDDEYRWSEMPDTNSILTQRTSLHLIIFNYNKWKVKLPQLLPLFSLNLLHLTQLFHCVVGDPHTILHISSQDLHTITFSSLLACMLRSKAEWSSYHKLVVQVGP
jgi:hypothetical protein